MQLCRYTWVFRGHFFLDFPVSSKNNAHFIQKRSIRNKTRVRTFPLISRRFPLISRRFPLIFWDTTCKSRFPLIFSFSAQNLKRAKKMPRAPKSDQMEDPGMSWYFYRCAARTVRKSGVTHFGKGVESCPQRVLRELPMQSAGMSWYFYRCALPYCAQNVV